MAFTAGQKVRASELNALAAGAWATLPLIGGTTLAPLAVTGVEAGGKTSPTSVQYRVEGTRVFLRGWAISSGGFAAGVNGSNPLLTVALPVAVRPAFPVLLWPFNDLPAPNSGAFRMEIGTDGQLRGVRAGAANTFYNFDQSSWPIG